MNALPPWTAETTRGYQDAIHDRPKASLHPDYIHGYQMGTCLLAIEMGALRWQPNDYEDPNDPDTQAINATINRRLSQRPLPSCWDGK